MNVIVAVSGYIIPAVMLFIVIHGMIKKVNVYDEFVTGAKDGMKTVVSIAPTLVGLMMAVGVLRASGFLDMISGFIGKIGLPSPVIPLLIVRMFSSSAATGLTLDLFKEYGTDSLIGLIASIASSATETIFFTISVYSVAAKITKTRWTLSGALISTLAGIVSSVILAMLMI
jgi:spore maturation protein B